MSNDIAELIEKHKNFKKRVKTINRLMTKAEITHHRSPKAVKTPLGEFKTQRAAAAAHGICETTMSQWLRGKKEGFTYIKEDDEEN